MKLSDSCRIEITRERTSETGHITFPVTVYAFDPWTGWDDREDESGHDLTISEFERATELLSAEEPDFDEHGRFTHAARESDACTDSYAGHIGMRSDRRDSR